MNLTLGQRDAIARHLQTGVTRCGERLAKMSGTEWGVMSTSVNEIPAVRLLSWFHRTKGKHVGANLRARKGLTLEVLTLFPDKSARSITTAVTEQYADRLARLPQLVPMTIAEVSNIMAQGLVGALADGFDEIVILSSPEVDWGEKSELLAWGFERYDGRKDVLLMSHVEFYSKNLAATCNVVIIVGVSTLRRLFKKRMTA
ncbi:hypothetical protein ACFL2T_06100 [Elusimicrobiota bacterium]